MSNIPGFRLDLTGASGSQGLLGPKSGWRAYMFPRGAHASQDSTGNLITFDSFNIASRFAVNNWIQAGFNTANIRKVSAVGGNSISIAGSAVTVAMNDRIFLIGNTQPTISGGSATYRIPNTIIRQRGDNAATLFTNSMITSNSNGLIQGYARAGIFDILIQDNNQANQDSIVDFSIGNINDEGFQTFVDGDTSPSVISGNRWKTNNTSQTIISSFDDGTKNQEIYVAFGDTFTTIDFSSTTLKGNGGLDWLPDSGDSMNCLFDGANWFCIPS